MENSLISRFEAKFIPEPNSGCWLWTAAANKRGYGHFGVNGEVRDAHRVSYELYVGPIGDGLSVLHRCDIPSCVRPDHLFLGTQKENLEDMTVKGRRRTAKGEERRSSKLTATIAEKIRADKRTHREIAVAFGISKSQVGAIRLGLYWKP